MAVISKIDSHTQKKTKPNLQYRTNLVKSSRLEIRGKRNGNDERGSYYHGNRLSNKSQNSWYPEQEAIAELIQDHC